MTHPIFDRLTNPATMLAAELELLQRPAEAVDALRELLSGQARNSFSVPYRDLGLPLSCALEVAARLGPVAKPLEPYLREEADAGSWVAAKALAGLGALDDESVKTLARGLLRDFDMAAESALALITCGVREHPAVLEALAQSETAARHFLKIETLFKDGGGHERLVGQVPNPPIERTACGCRSCTTLDALGCLA